MLIDAVILILMHTILGLTNIFWKQDKKRWRVMDIMLSYLDPQF